MNRLGACLLVAAIALTTSGCTARAWYEGAQTAAIQACLREPPSEREACESRINKADYEAYEKERLSK